MLTVDTERWHQNAETLREQALSAEHHRTRERFLAIYEVTKGKSATQVGLMTKRNRPNGDGVGSSLQRIGSRGNGLPA